jgi:hypothetical protein
MKGRGYVILIILLFTPLWMWIAWLFTPKKILNVVIVDKTVLNTKCTEHCSFTWILDNQRYCKPDMHLYSIPKDYYGFFPKEDKKYETHGLETLSYPELDSLAGVADVTYFTDTYGIYYNEWYLHHDEKERSRIIYGAMNEKDLYFLRGMKNNKKLILTEFNDIESPTSGSVRKEFEEMFNIKWTGWVGRYFDQLDTLKTDEIPEWMIHGYMQQHDNKWNFSGPGIAFVNEDNRIEVLEHDKDLKTPVPVIETPEKWANYYSVLTRMKYPYWFDIMHTSQDNDVVSEISIKTTARGDSIMNKNDIPLRFPAVIAHDKEDYRFYYFTGDFADNPIAPGLSDYRGIISLRWFLYNKRNAERESFFWEYYLPMTQKILENYYSGIHHKSIAIKD